MTQPDWTKLTEVEVPAKPEGLWTLAYAFVEGPRKLRITVPDEAATWNWNATSACGADGHPGEGYTSNHLCASAPTGALIGKVGGSTAEKPEAARVFAVGRHCILTLKEKDKDAGGPLYLTMNDTVNGFRDHSGCIKVLIEEAP